MKDVKTYHEPTRKRRKVATDCWSQKTRLNAKQAKNFNLNLPRNYPWKILSELHKDLSQFLTEEDNDYLTRIIRSQDIDSYLSLSEAWGLQSISPTGTNTYEMSVSKYQLTSLLKKFEFATSLEQRRNTALKKFFAAESSCRMMNNNCSLPGAYICKSDFAVWHHARHFIKNVLGERLPEQSKLTDKARHGPGATDRKSVV